jgi:hypothetical protein
MVAKAKIVETAVAGTAVFAAADGMISGGEP